MNKRLAGTGLAIGLVAGAGAGLVLELSGSAGASPGVAAVVPATADTTPDTTAPDSTTPGTPMPDHPDAATKLQAILQPLIDDGTITQAQADKIIAALQAAGPFGKGGPFGGRHMMGPRAVALDVVANALGITADEVRTALQNGQSLADLAVSKGKTAQDVIDAIVADVTTKINDRVTAGDLTQAQADKIITDVKTQAAAFVNSTPGDLPFLGGPLFGGMGKGGGPWMGGPGRHHPDNDGDADDNPSSGTPADTTPTTVTG